MSTPSRAVAPSPSPVAAAPPTPGLVSPRARAAAVNPRLDDEVVFECERWLVAWRKPHYVCADGHTPCGAPDEIGSWSCGPWDYEAGNPLEGFGAYNRAGRAPRPLPRTGIDVLRRREWRAPRTAAAPVMASSAASAGADSPSSSVFAPHEEAVVRGTWVQNAPSGCSCCGEPFLLLRTPKHHCRECGRVACAACTGRVKLLLRAATAAGGEAEVLRVCVDCFRAPQGPKAEFRASALDVPEAAREPLVSAMARAGESAPTPAARRVAARRVAALDVELGDVLEAEAVENASLGETAADRAAVFSTCARIFLERGVWDARALWQTRAAAQLAGVRLAAITLDHALTVSIALRRTASRSGSAAGAAAQRILARRPKTSAPSAAWRVVPAVTAAVAIVATGGAAAAVFGVALGVSALVGATVAAASGGASAVASANAAAAARSRDELAFECLTHEALMSPRGQRSLAASRRERTGASAAATHTSEHSSDLSGVTIAISGLRFAEADGSTAEQRLLADFAAPWGGVENVDAVRDGILAAASSPLGEPLPESGPGWWGRVREAAHSGELYAFIWGWSALAALAPPLLAAAASAQRDADLEAAGGRRTVAGLEAASTVGLAIGRALDALQLSKSPWLDVCREAKAAGKSLALALLRGAHGRRPVTLLSFGFGANVAYYCARELGRIAAEHERLIGAAAEPDGIESACWDAVPAPEGASSAGAAPETVILDLILIGAVVDTSPEELALVRRAVSGRIVCTYSSCDELLIGAERLGLLRAPIGLHGFPGPEPAASTPTSFSLSSSSLPSSSSPSSSAEASAAPLRVNASGCESWDTTLIAPRHRDLGTSLLAILEAACVLGTDSCELFAGANRPRAAAPPADSEAVLRGLLEVKRLGRLAAALQLAAARVDSHGLASPDFDECASLLRALRSGAAVLLQRFPDAVGVAQLKGEAMATAGERLRELALELFVDVDVADFSESASAGLHSAAGFLDALGTAAARDELLARLCALTLAPLQKGAASVPVASGAAAAVAAAAALLRDFPRRYASFATARAAAEVRFRGVLPARWRIGAALSAAFAADTRATASRVLATLRPALRSGATAEALLHSVAEANACAVRFEVAEAEEARLARAEGDLEAAAPTDPSLLVSALFTEAMAPSEAAPPVAARGSRTPTAATVPVVAAGGGPRGGGHGQGHGGLLRAIGDLFASPAPSAVPAPAPAPRR